jgi:hypothetical protein
MSEQPATTDTRASAPCPLWCQRSSIVTVIVGLSSLDPRCGITAELEVGHCLDCGQPIIRQSVRVDLAPDGGPAVREEDIVTLESPWYRAPEWAGPDPATTTGNPRGNTVT